MLILAFRHGVNSNYLYLQLRIQYPELYLPDVSLPAVYTEKPLPKEQSKALTPEVRMNFVALLEQQKDNGLATGGVLMIGMARTAEAVAVRFGDIQFFEDYSVVTLIAQGDGVTYIERMKSDSSYRKTVVGKWGTHFLLERKRQLLAEGYSEEAIQTMYVVSPDNDPTAMASPNHLSAYLKLLLYQAGCTPDFWLNLGALMEKEPDLDEDGKPCLDATAYILRRDGCTVLCNVCGIDPYLVDSMMGHCLPRAYLVDWPAYLRNSDNWPVLAAQVERMVHHPDYTCNPLLAPQILSQEKAFYESTLGQKGYCFQADPNGNQPITVEFHVQATEMDDFIRLETKGTIVTHESRSSLDKNFAPIIGAVYSRKVYETQMKKIVDAVEKENGYE